MDSESRVISPPIIVHTESRLHSRMQLTECTQLEHITFAAHVEGYDPTVVNLYFYTHNTILSN